MVVKKLGKRQLAALAKQYFGVDIDTRHAHYMGHAGAESIEAPLKENCGWCHLVFGVYFGKIHFRLENEEGTQSVTLEQFPA